MLLPPSRRAWYRTRLGPANVVPEPARPEARTPGSDPSRVRRGEVEWRRSRVPAPRRRGTRVFRAHEHVSWGQVWGQTPDVSCLDAAWAGGWASSAEREVRQPVGQVDGRGLRRLVVLAGEAAEALVLVPAGPDGERRMPLLGDEGPAHRGRSLREREGARAVPSPRGPSPSHRRSSPSRPADSASRRPGATPETATPVRRLPSHGTAAAARTGRASIAA